MKSFGGQKGGSMGAWICVVKPFFYCKEGRKEISIMKRVSVNHLIFSTIYKNQDNMRQSRIEIEYYSIAYFERITEFNAV